MTWRNWWLFNGWTALSFIILLGNLVFESNLWDVRMFATISRAALFIGKVIVSAVVKSLSLTPSVLIRGTCCNRLSKLATLVLYCLMLRIMIGVLRNKSLLVFSKRHLIFISNSLFFFFLIRIVILGTKYNDRSWLIWSKRLETLFLLTWFFMPLSCYCWLQFLRFWLHINILYLICFSKRIFMLSLFLIFKLTTVQAYRNLILLL